MMSPPMGRLGRWCIASLLVLFAAQPPGPAAAQSAAPPVPRVQPHPSPGTTVAPADTTVTPPATVSPLDPDTALGTSIARGASPVAATLHNLSSSGPGDIVAPGESEICVFCHTPHLREAATPLWNRDLPSGPFLPYTSPSLDSVEGTTAPQPGGASKLCLSCHDGTLALGRLLSRREEIVVQGTAGGRLPPGSPGFIGRDLSGAHPISFLVTEQLVARNNAKDSRLASVAEMMTDPEVRLDAMGRIQCTTCHDAHDDRNFPSSGIHFYRKAHFSDVCDVCHRL